MAVKKYLYNNAGAITEEASVDASTGNTDAGKIVALNTNGILDATIVNSKTSSVGSGDSGVIPALDASGRLSNSFMPTGIGADTASISTSESLAAGNLINIFDDAGAGKVRKADASQAGFEAHGFVMEAFTHPTTATIYFEGNNSSVTGLTPGRQYLSATTAGTSTDTAPSGTGKVVQVVGFATAATNINFQSGTPIVLA